MGNLAKIATIFLFVLVGSVRAQIALEAESAQLSGVSTATTIAGYSGTGYVVMGGTGTISFQVQAPQKGTYKLVLRVATPSGPKSQDLWVNGAFSSALAFPGQNSWFDYAAGSVVLNAGANTVEIRKNWGYMSFDKATFTLALPNDYSLVTPNLIDPLANAKTKAVYAWMRSQYGKVIVSGQTAYWNETIALAGKTPVQRAFDFQTYTQGYPYLWKNGAHTFGWTDDGTTKAAIDWYNSTQGRGLVSFQWHWHSPTGGTVSTNTFYTNQTTFDVRQAVITGTQQNKDVVRDIDSIATQLKRLQSAGVPVLWRPLHEAGGAWFWWGAHGAETTKKLWDMVYDRLTVHHGLHNLIWVWSSPEPDWYPGNAKVDIIGYDSYPGAFVYGTQKAVFDQLFALVEGKKMVAMTENGPIPDIDACVAEDAMWAYFSSWSDLVASQNSAAHMQKVYGHVKVLTLDEIDQAPVGILRNPNNANVLGSTPFSGRYDLQGRRK